MASPRFFCNEALSVIGPSGGLATCSQTSAGPSLGGKYWRLMFWIVYAYACAYGFSTTTAGATELGGSAARATPHNANAPARIASKGLSFIDSSSRLLL